MKDFFQIFWAFFKVGGLTFGGGYAMMPILQKEVVEKKNWISQSELLDFYAVGQCIPGIIAVNTSIFIGYRHQKLKGALAAAFGVVTPSLIIIMVIAAFIQNFTDLPVVQSAFAGINAAVAALVVNAIIKMWKAAVVDKLCACIFVASFFLSAGLKLSPVFIVIGAACLGIVVKRAGRKKAS